MKSVYYKRLIADRMDLSAGERIVYSNLVYDAIYNYEESFNKESGKFDPIILNDEETIPVGFTISCQSIMRRNTISRSNAGNIINNLISKGLLDNTKKNVFHNNLYENGYFELQLNSGLKGELLIFYSWLINISKGKKVIFCTRKKLSDMYHITEDGVMFFLKQLKKYGLVERDNDNKLIIK